MSKCPMTCRCSVFVCVCVWYVFVCVCVSGMVTAPALFASQKLQLCFSLLQWTASGVVPVKDKPGTHCSVCVFQGSLVDQCECVYVVCVCVCAQPVCVWACAPCGKIIQMPFVVCASNHKSHNVPQTAVAQCTHAMSWLQNMTENQIKTDVLRKYLYHTEMTRKEERKESCRKCGCIHCSGHFLSSSLQRVFTICLYSL